MLFFVREYADDAEIKINLLKKQQLINPIILPTILKDKGLDANRQWYLFEEIRPLCFGIDSKDVVCPKPSIPKPVIVMKEERDKLRKCSYCKETGHDRSSSGKIICPLSLSNKI